MQIKFKYFSVGINTSEQEMLVRLADENTNVADFGQVDWETVDLLYKKHIIVYDKTREKKPEIQPWCRSVVLRTLSKNQSGN
jgi:Uri superfamily endonuclease